MAPNIFTPTEPFGHALCLYTCVGVCKGVCVYNVTVTTSAYLQIAASMHDRTREQRDTAVMSLDWSNLMFVYIVWCHNGPISNPLVCATTRAQIYIWGVAFSRERPSGDSCRRGKHERRRAVFVFEEVKGQRPLCKRHHYHRHRRRLLIGDALYTRCECKQLFPLFLPRDGSACWWWTKPPLCSAELLTSICEETSTLFVASIFLL